MVSRGWSLSARARHLAKNCPPSAAADRVECGGPDGLTPALTARGRRVRLGPAAEHGRAWRASRSEPVRAAASRPDARRRASPRPGPRPGSQRVVQAPTKSAPLAAALSDRGLSAELPMSLQTAGRRLMAPCRARAGCSRHCWLAGAAVTGEWAGRGQRCRTRQPNTTSSAATSAGRTPTSAGPTPGSGTELVCGGDHGTRNAGRAPAIVFPCGDRRSQT